MDIRGRRPRILIIDDEPVVLESCTEILLDQPYEMTTADRGQRGLEMVDEFQPDLVFVDLKMPGMSGIEVLEEVNRRDPAVVTVVITGYATVDSAIEAMKRGAYDFIPKPFTPDQFRVVTRRSLEKRRLVLETIALRREKEMLRENFAAIVSHELKSPLNAVQQNLFVLSRQLTDAATPEQQERLDRMQSRIADLLEMVDTWLRSVTVDAGSIEERFGPLPISLPITKAIECVEPHATRKGVAITTSFGPSPVTVLGDEVTLTEAFTNIVGNAIKYSHPNGTVTITTKRLNTEVRVDIADDGVGIADDDLPHVFEDFYRSDTGALQVEGIGLGLAISRRIIEAHDGTVSIESRAGEGTTVTVLLPTPPPPDARETPAHPERSQAG